MMAENESTRFRDYDWLDAVLEYDRNHWMPEEYNYEFSGYRRFRTPGLEMGGDDDDGIYTDSAIKDMAGEEMRDMAGEVIDDMSVYG
jgi:hypothetical protein